MKFRIDARIIVSALFAALAIPVGVAAQEQQPQEPAKLQHYKLTMLPTLGGSWSIAQGMNIKGQVVGGAYLPGDVIFHASLWQHGTVTDLGSLQGGPFSITYTNPNERGEVSGYSNTQTPDPNGEDFCLAGTHLICLGFVWRDGVMSALPTLGGINGQAYQINDRGQVVGVAENNTPDATCSVFSLEAKPVVWQDGMVQELQTVPGDPDGWGYGINDQGQIVGATGTCFANQPAASLHAVLWPDGPGGGLVDLGNLGGTNSNIPFYISNQGQVVGLSGVPGNIYWHAFLWTQATGMQDLGTLPGDSWSWANNINDKNQAVGISFPPVANERAFIWQNGVMTDLNTLIPAGSPLYLLEAFGINNRGQIAGWGQLANGDYRAFLLDPCEDGDVSCGDGAAGARVTTQGSPAHVIEHSTTAPPVNPALVGRAMMNRFRARRSPGLRAPGPSTKP